MAPLESSLAEISQDNSRHFFLYSSLQGSLFHTVLLLHQENRAFPRVPPPLFCNVFVIYQVTSASATLLKLTIRCLAGS